MAEYYPLLAKAVSGLTHSTPEARRSIYERARNALPKQLRSIQPPIAEADIDREAKALDAAIARLEAELSVQSSLEEGLEAALGVSEAKPISTAPAKLEPAKPEPAKPAAPPPAPPVEVAVEQAVEPARGRRRRPPRPPRKKARPRPPKRVDSAGSPRRRRRCPRRATRNSRPTTTRWAAKLRHPCARGRARSVRLRRNRPRTKGANAASASSPAWWPPSCASSLSQRGNCATGRKTSPS